MAFNEWFIKKITKIDYKIIIQNLGIEEKFFLKLISGEEKPDINLMIKIMYLFNLNEEEKIEYFSAIAKTFNLSPNVVYQLFALHIAELTHNEELDKISMPRN